MVTVLTDTPTIEPPAGRVEGNRLWLSEAKLENATGWSSREEGLCREDVCVPIPPGREHDFLREGQIDAAAVWGTSRRTRRPQRGCQRLGARGGRHRARVGAAVARGTEPHAA
jgi:hypothetical protein